ncbi:hypothetical protein [Pseudopelagicola sp. nBUS_19]|uniref:hypothetical protein n=1 Tax=Pseudopelagicola sp. nBUS_19 TaxID=3395316 RepID=UPI003EB72BB0
MCVTLFLNGFFRLMLIVAESGHLSGLLARYALPLALMKLSIGSLMTLAGFEGLTAPRGFDQPHLSGPC